MNPADSKPTVLVVDDDVGLARLIERAVRREGFATAVAHSGAEATAWLTTHKAALMLLDLKLQDVTGAELVEALAAKQGSVPFVVITGQGDERVAVEMMKRGALDYLVKDGQFLEFVPAVVQRAFAKLDVDRRLMLAEEGLRNEHAFSKAVLQTSGAIMVVVDATGHIVEVNQAFEKVTGHKHGEVTGKLFWETVLPRDAWEASKERLLTTIQKGEPREQEGQLLTKDGRVRSIMWHVTALRSGKGAPDYIIASGLDVTDRRHLEQEVLDISELEQQRIGQDLHDGLCQVLAGVEVMMEVLRKRMAQHSASDACALATIAGYVRDATRQSRMLARGLSPVEIDSRGLMSALTELANSTHELFKVRCDFICKQPVLVEDVSKATHIYRIAQESISNAVKHGRAKVILLSLESEGDTTRLKIADDGTGFSCDVSKSNGMGLRTMKYRASAIGATLEIRSAPAKGTTVVCAFTTGV